MKLTIYLAVNEEYIDFTKVFLYSLRENFPEEKLKKIIINDLGLTPEQREELVGFHSKVQYISTVEEKILSEEIHSEDWRLAISHKTEGLYNICEEENYPILMIDADTYIMEDFSKEIFYGCDVQVCTQNDEWGTLDYIGCWFVAHNDKAKEFIHRWRTKMESINKNFKETPALCEVMDLINSRAGNTHFTVKENHEEDVCAVHYSSGENDSAPKILHFRSNPTTNTLLAGEKGCSRHIMSRTDYISNLPNDIKALFYRIETLS
jgi:hypothetical protein